MSPSPQKLLGQINNSWIPVFSFISQIFSEQKSLFINQRVNSLFTAMSDSWNLDKAFKKHVQILSYARALQGSSILGVKGYATKDAFESIARQEMKHAESIAERLFYLGGIPTTKPEPINVGKTLKEMVAQDVKDEQNAITMYKGIIEAARKESDETTAFLFMEILKDEEDHHDTFTTLLEQIWKAASKRHLLE